VLRVGGGRLLGRPVFGVDGVFAFGDARYLGRGPSTRTDAIGLVASVNGAGYRIVRAAGTVTSIGSLRPLSGLPVDGRVVAASS
jgi:hypothetical protein